MQNNPYGAGARALRDGMYQLRDGMRQLNDGMRGGESAAMLPDRTRGFQVAAAAQPAFTFGTPSYQGGMQYAGRQFDHDAAYNHWPAPAPSSVTSSNASRSNTYNNAYNNVARPALAKRSTPAADVTKSKEYLALLRKYEARGLTISKHEARLRDANDLLPLLKRRLDPLWEANSVINKPAVWQSIRHRCTSAFSKEPSMQSHYDFLVAYDYLMSTNASSTTSNTTSNTASNVRVPPLQSHVNDDRRLASMTATIQLQTGLIQEQSETIRKLNERLADAHTNNPRVVSHKDKVGNGATGGDRAVRSVADINKLLGKKASAAARPRKRRALVTTKENTQFVRQIPVTFAPPENHSSLTFQGFSQQNQVNPARLDLLRAPSSPASLQSPEMAVVPKTGANIAPLAFDRRRLGSPDYQERTDVRSGHSSGSSNYTGRADMRSKRAMPLLEYDDAPPSRRDSPNKRIKSGDLTPPLPNDFLSGSAAVAQQVDFSTDGGVPIKKEAQDLEMGEIVQEDSAGAGDTGSGTGHGYAYDELDDMITHARTEAGS